jgi:hypothetical protein
MERFERLLESDATDFERELLDAAAEDAPSERARRRTLAAMGVGAGVVVGAPKAAHAATKLVATGGTGMLQPEAVVLRVRALLALGERRQAERVANRFIAAHPDGAQSGRLRALIGAR